jgi:hypothetical protein
LTANQVAKPNEQQRQRRQKQHRLNLVHPPSPALLISAAKILTHRDCVGYNFRLSAQCSVANS